MTSNRKSVLLVEDDLAVRQISRAVLAANQFDVIDAETGQSALAEIAIRHPDVMLLDLGLPDMSGLDVIRQLPQPRDFPIVVFSANGLHHDKIAAIDAGANDFIAKPFFSSELLSRIRSVLGGFNEIEHPSTSLHGGVRLDVDLPAGRVAVDNREVRLTSRELRLLTVFTKNAGRLLTYRFLVHEIAESAETPDTAELTKLVSQLRHKLEPDPLRPCFFCAEPGIGYRFQDD